MQLDKASLLAEVIDPCPSHKANHSGAPGYGYQDVGARSSPKGSRLNKSALVLKPLLDTSFL